ASDLEGKPATQQQPRVGPARGVQNELLEESKISASALPLCCLVPEILRDERGRGYSASPSAEHGLFYAIENTLDEENSNNDRRHRTGQANVQICPKDIHVLSHRPDLLLEEIEHGAQAEVRHPGSGVSPVEAPDPEEHREDARVLGDSDPEEGPASRLAGR